MNAEETLERIRKRHDVTLPVLGDVTIQLPRIRDCVIAGSVPLPVLKHLQDAASNGGISDLAPEEVEASARFQDEIVRQTLIAINGEAVTMTTEAVAALDQEDYDALLRYGLRETPLVASSV